LFKEELDMITLINIVDEDDMGERISTFAWSNASTFNGVPMMIYVTGNIPSCSVGPVPFVCE